MDVGSAQLLVRDLLARGRLDERRAADEDRPLAADDDRLVAHRRDIGPARGARAHDDRDLGDAERGQPGLVVEDPAEVLLVRERPGLVREEDPARIDEVDAGQPVLQGHLLGADVLLDGHREVGPALDRGVVGHDEHLAAVDDADAGDHARRRGLVVVHAVGGQRAELQEGRVAVEEPVQPLADEELSPRLVQLAVFRRAALLDLGQPLLVFGHDPGHVLDVSA